MYINIAKVSIFYSAFLTSSHSGVKGYKQAHLLAGTAVI
jgi:hypothetical protein